MQRIFSAAQISMTVARVTPSGQATTRLVARPPLRTIKTCVAFVSATQPRVSSMRASSAPALLAAGLAQVHAAAAVAPLSFPDELAAFDGRRGQVDSSSDDMFRKAVAVNDLFKVSFIGALYDD